MPNSPTAPAVVERDLPKTGDRTTLTRTRRHPRLAVASVYVGPDPLSVAYLVGYLCCFSTDILFILPAKSEHAIVQRQPPHVTPIHPFLVYIWLVGWV